MLITNFEGIAVDEFLVQKGERVRWTRVEQVHEVGAALLPEVEHRLAELQALETRHLTARVVPASRSRRTTSYELRDDKRAEAPTTELRFDDAGWFGDEWAEAATVAEQRAVLDDAMSRIWVRRGGTGRRTEAQVLARLTFDWRVPEDLGPVALVR